MTNVNHQQNDINNQYDLNEKVKKRFRRFDT